MTPTKQDLELLQRRMTQMMASMRTQMEQAVADVAPKQAWPIGSIHTNVDGSDPATTIGYGTWVQFAAGRVLVGYAAGDPDFGTPLAEVGAKTSAHTHTYTQVVQHTHAVTVDGGDHVHPIGMSTGLVGLGGNKGFQGSAISPDTEHDSEASNPSVTATTANPAGSVATGTTASTAPSVIQPSIVVYFWRRTA